MKWLFTTNLGNKILMSLTGLFLSLFLVIHLLGNLQLLMSDSGYAFNMYAFKMTHNPLIKIISYGNYFFILLHAVKGLYLVFMNKSKKGQAPKVNAGSANSKWSSRNMGVLGSLILIFIVIHMVGFWGQYKFGEPDWMRYTTDLSTHETVASDFVGQKGDPITVISNNGTEIFTTKNLYGIVYNAYSNIMIVLFYVLSMIVLGFHLSHGFSSAFQTLGLGNRKYMKFIKLKGIVFSILIPLGFALLPIIIYLTK